MATIWVTMFGNSLVPSMAWVRLVPVALAVDAELEGRMELAERIVMLVRAMRVKSNLDSGIPQAIQQMAITALEGPQDVIDEHNAIYQRRRDRLRRPHAHRPPGAHAAATRANARLRRLPGALAGALAVAASLVLAPAYAASDDDLQHAIHKIHASHSDKWVVIRLTGDGNANVLGGGAGSDIADGGDGEAALAHLAEHVRTGVEFLVLPATAFWWLEHYAGLADRLEPAVDGPGRDAEQLGGLLLGKTQRERAPDVLTAAGLVFDSVAVDGTPRRLVLSVSSVGVRKAVREQVKHGADLIKIGVTGAVLVESGSPGATHFNEDEIRALVEEVIRERHDHCEFCEFDWLNAQPADAG